MKTDASMEKEWSLTLCIFMCLTDIFIHYSIYHGKGALQLPFPYAYSLMSSTLLYE